MILEHVRDPALDLVEVVAPVTRGNMAGRPTFSRSLAGLTLGLMIPFYIALLIVWLVARTLLTAMGVGHDGLDRISTLLIG